VVEPHTGPRQLQAAKTPRVQPIFRGLGESGEEDRFAVVKLRFEIPEGGLYYRISRDFPEMIVEVRGSHILPDGRVMAELHVIGPDLTELLEAMRREPDVVAVTVAATEGPAAKWQIVVTRSSPFILVAGDLEVLVRYPRVIQNGMFTVEVAGRVSQLQRLISELKRIYPHVEVARFGRDRMRTVPDTLTPRQDALLHQALAAGYFDVPRRVSLTQLAVKLGKSKSSLSGGLAIAEKKLVESAAISRG